MLLKSLHLENFRQFEELHIDFDEKMTVLVGPNASGKTAVLDAAAVSLATFFYAFDVPMKPIARSDARLASSRIGGFEEVRAMYPVRVEACGEVLGESLSWTRTLNTDTGKTTRVEAKQMIDLSKSVRAKLDMDVDSKTEGRALVLPLISYYGTGRLWAQKRLKQEGKFDAYKRELGYENCLDAASDDKRFMSWMERMDYAEYKERRPVSQYRMVCDVMARLFASVSDSAKAEASYDPRVKDAVVRFYQNGSPIELPLHSLSDGYRTVLGMVGDMAYRMCELNPQLGGDAIRKTPGVVLIDEVDLHLHPKWQVRVLRDLEEQFPLVQFIVTTHAPSVIASVDKTNIRMLDGTDMPGLPQSQTYGRDASSIFREVMDAPQRQSDVEDLFLQLNDSIDREDVKRAKMLVEELESKIGDSDPDLTAARTTIWLME